MATSPKYWSDTRLEVQFPSHVAPVGVLVAISIPIFTAQLEKAREATDAANIRSAYAEAVADALTADPSTTTSVSKEVTIKQQKEGWESAVDDIGGVDVSSLSVKAGDVVVVTAYTDGSTATTIAKKTS